MGWYKDKSGNPVWIDDSAPRAVPIGPQNPTYQYQGPQAQANLNRTYADMGNDRERLAMERERIAMARQQQQLQAQDQQAKNAQSAAELQAKDPYNAQQLESSATDAMNKLRTIDRIGQNYQDSTLPSVGFGASTVSGWGGTGASNIKAGLNELKAGGALNEVMKMTQATGKNPFTPMSNSDVDLIARNISGVDQTQSPGDFFQSLKPYQDAYTRAYAGAVGGQTLNSETQRQYDKYIRENPNASPAQRQRFQQVLQTDARKRYEATMRQQSVRNAPRKQPAIDPEVEGYLKKYGAH